MPEEQPDTSANSVQDAEPAPLTGLSVAKSVVGAALGVQTAETRKRDFTSGKIAPFIIGGVVFTVLFVLVIVGVVQLVLP